MERWDRAESGMAMLMVLLVIVILAGVGAFMMLGVDRNTELRAAFQKNVAGFQAAEAGINLGATTVLNTLQANQLPINCSPQMLFLNGRTVTYTLSGCGGTPQWVTLPPDDPYAGLGASAIDYTLTSSAVNAQGYTEALLTMRFEARQIPLFQFLAFYQGDLEYLPAPAAVLNGRLHTNGDMYLNTADCGSPPSGGLQILGPITIGGSGLIGTSPLNRGPKDQLTNASAGHVYISLDGTTANDQILGTDAQGSTNCGPVGLRQISQSEVNSWGGRIRTGVKSLTMPATTNMYCAPWNCPGGQAPPASGYWQSADLRIVLDLTATPAHLSGAFGPALPPVNVVDVLGNVDSAKTHQLQVFMQTVAGAITYNDLPTGSQWDCAQYASTCESTTYNAGANGYKGYTPNFPSATSTCPIALTSPRQPRTTITANNYCYDYRYGGFYNWRERKPILMLNVDWMALEEWNRNNANALFNPAATANNGLVIFLAVHGSASQGANDYGVRIYDAARARRGSADLGITFATDGAMYVLGNFNCPQPNTSAGTSAPAACGPAGDQKPTSLAADTVNVLSCAWIQTGACASIAMDQDQWPGWPNATNNPYRPVDERSTTGPAWTGWDTGGQPATQTIMNAALVTGADSTWCPGNAGGLNCGSSYYGGGLENITRFHEDWTGQQFWYAGSIVAMGTPGHTCSAVAAQWTPTANDPRFTCSAYPQQGFTMLTRYVPPAREWFYDTTFNNPGTLPPLTPIVVSAKQVFFSEPLQ